MRAKLMMRGCPYMTAHDAALLILMSDHEVALNTEATSVGTGRSVASLKAYNSKITHTTLYGLVKEGLVEQVGFKFRLVKVSN